MNTRAKNGVLLFLAAAVILTALFLLPVSARALTRSEAVAWVRSQEGKTDSDIDGNGKWCVDLATAYMNYCWLRTNNDSSNPWKIHNPYTTYYAYQYDNQFAGNPNWYIFERTASTPTEPGDLFVSEQDSNYNGNGHIGIILEPHGTTGAKIIEMIGGVSPRIKDVTWGSGGPSYYAEHIMRFVYFTPEVVTGGLDVNGVLDGSNAGNVTGYGTFDVYINGSLVSNDVTDYAQSSLAAGTTYEIKDIRAASGHIYSGVAQGNVSGVITANVTDKVFLKFFTQYTISYNANGGTNAPAAQKKTHGTALTLNSSKPSYDGYTFMGWATSASATSATYQAGGSYTADASVTLYAVWKPKTITVTLAPTGGTVSPTSKSVSYGSSYGTLPTPTRTGYSFDGWYTDAEGGSKVTASTVLTQQIDHTIYAHWSPMGELTLPSAMQTIEEEAFMGNSHITHVEIPANCSGIGKKAFASCASLVSVRILGRSTTFESDTFVGSPNVVIYCYSDSRAQRLASADGIEYHLIGVPSDWVLADNVPSGAEITDRKWTYTTREYTENSSASYSGWTRYNSERTSWTTWSAWQDTEISATSDREVETQQVITGYNMISYCVSGPNGRSYQPVQTYTLRAQHGPYWWSKATLNSATVFTAGSYFNYASNVAGYVLDGTAYCKMDGSDDGGYIPMFIQSTTYGTQWRSRDAVYTYYYYRDVNGESATNPSGQENVSNVQEWVKYIY